MIGRDHLDAGSVASPYRETEAMRDGSDAIADWPILNALVNVAAGATWVSVHHGGGVGIGNSIHAGMVVVADGTDEMAERLERVLTTDPGMGVVRHLDAGYEEAARRRPRARPRAAERPSLGGRWPTRLLVRDLAQLATPDRRTALPARGGDLGRGRRARATRTSCCGRTASSRPSGGCATSVRSTVTSRRSTVVG